MEITLYCLAVVAAAVITGLLGRFMVPFLHKLKFGQTIREVGPSWHKNKQGTPTMGGLMFIIGGLAAAVVCIAFLWMHGGAETQLMLVRIVAGALMAVGFGLVGFMDDYISIKKHRNLGLTEIQKLVLQFIIAAAYLVSVSMAGGTTETLLPFIGTVDLGVFYYFIAAVLIVGMVNAVNFTDGLDGLNSSVTIVVCLTFSVIAMMLSMKGLSILAAAMVRLAVSRRLRVRAGVRRQHAGAASARRHHLYRRDPLRRAAGRLLQADPRQAYLQDGADPPPFRDVRLEGEQGVLCVQRRNAGRGHSGGSARLLRRIKV